MPRKKKKPTDPQDDKSSFHEKLEGFDIRINSFGEMESTFDIEDLNQFLDEEIDDKKLKKKNKEEEE
jgi:hypothetical protein